MMNGGYRTIKYQMGIGEQQSRYDRQMSIAYKEDSVAGIVM